MIEDQNEWAILGLTNSGDVFDVPEWPERLCGMLADRAGDKREVIPSTLHRQLSMEFLR